jgi:hypothetical protein
MSIRTKLLCVLLVASSGIACGASGPAFQREEPSETEGTIYIYRPDEICLSGQSPTVALDNVPIGRLKNGGYLWRRVEPGVHTVKITGVENLDVGQYVNVGAGEEAFVKWRPICQERAGTTTFSVNINEIGGDQALGEIAETRFCG